MRTRIIGSTLFALMLSTVGACNFLPVDPIDPWEPLPPPPPPDTSKCPWDTTRPPGGWWPDDSTGWEGGDTIWYEEDPGGGDPWGGDPWGGGPGGGNGRGG